MLYIQFTQSNLLPCSKCECFIPMVDMTCMIEIHRLKNCYRSFNEKVGFIFAFVLAFHFAFPVSLLTATEVQYYKYLLPNGAQYPDPDPADSWQRNNGPNNLWHFNLFMIMWLCPWASSDFYRQMPQNLKSCKYYSSIGTWMLIMLSHLFFSNCPSTPFQAQTWIMKSQNQCCCTLIH